MKKTLLAFLTGLLFLFSACSSDNGGDKDDVTSETISAKWNVSGQSNYESFEFNKSGNYIVVAKSEVRSEDNNTVTFGTYTIKDNVIIMSDFGKLTVTDISSNAINFTLTLNNSSDAVNVSASKQPEVANTTKTELLCRTWISTGEPVDGLDGSITEEGIIVIFSQAGTYLVYNDDFVDGVGLAQWKWKGNNENEFYYSWGNWNDNWENTRAVIHELTKDRMVVVEKFPDEDDEITVLKPLENL